MADYELQGEITTNTIDSEILSAPIIESEMLLGDTVVIDHYYNGLESDTVKVTVDNDNNTIKADAVIDEKPTKNSNHLVTSGTIQNTNVMRNYVHLSSAASYNDVYTLLDNGNGCGIIPRISDTFIPFPDYLPPSPFAGQSVGDLTLFARITGRSSGTNLELEFTLLTLYGLEPAYKLNAYSHGTSGWTNTGWYKYDAAVLDFAESEYNKSKNLFNENKYLSSYCTYASNRWTTNSTRIGYNQSILTDEVGATDNRNTSKLPLLKKGTYTLTLFNVVNNTNDTTINIAFYNQDGTINGTFTTATITTNTAITFTLASDLYLDIRVSGDTGTISFDHIQVEKGSIATAYYPYSGEITHNGDAAVVFAEAERQKSKNLIPFPYYEGNSKTMNGITFTVNNDQSVSVAGSITNHDSNAVMYLAWDMPLKAGTYGTFIDSSNTDINVYLWIGDNYFSGEFTLLSDATARIYLQVTRYSTQTFNTTVKVMLCEGGIDTDWQPYHGEIVHSGEIDTILKYITLTGSSGTLTDSQLSLLEADNSNYIICDNEIFAASGDMTYSSATSGSDYYASIKTIKITKTSKSWVKYEQSIQPVLKVVEISGTSGTLTAAQVGMLDIMSSTIFNTSNNKLYILGKREAPTPIFYYFNTGKDNSNNLSTSCITVDISTRAWSLSDITPSRYKHTLYLNSADNKLMLLCDVYNSISTRLTIPQMAMAMSSIFTEQEDAAYLLCNGTVTGNEAGTGNEVTISAQGYQFRISEGTTAMFIIFGAKADLTTTAVMIEIPDYTTYFSEDCGDTVQPI